MVELGQIDIFTEVIMMSSHLALSWKGHLEAVFHMFSYLKKHHNSEVVFDPSEPEIDMADSPREDWSLIIYGDVKEGMRPTCPFAESDPADMPVTRGVGLTITVYVNCDLGGDCVTRRSRTGFTVFLNVAPIYWMIKKQSSCKVSTYGSELTRV